MEHYSHLWLFFVMVLGIIVLPGVDMAFVLASALTGGRKAGLAAVAGVVAGAVCHLVAGAFGFSLLLRTVPGLFSAMLLAGALYLAWIGWSLWRMQPAGDAPSSPAALAGPAQDSFDVDSPARAQRAGASRDFAKRAATPWATFRQATLTNLLNPKAYLFMLAIFPQFFRPEYGPLWIQALALGLITACTQTGVYGGLALLAGNARGWLAGNPRTSALMARAAGSVLMLGAVMTAFQGLAKTA